MVWFVVGWCFWYGMMWVWWCCIGFWSMWGRMWNFLDWWCIVGLCVVGSGCSGWLLCWFCWCLYLWWFILGWGVFFCVFVCRLIWWCCCCCVSWLCVLCWWIGLDSGCWFFWWCVLFWCIFDLNFGWNDNGYFVIWLMWFWKCWLWLVLWWWMVDLVVLWNRFWILLLNLMMFLLLWCFCWFSCCIVYRGIMNVLIGVWDCWWYGLFCFWGIVWCWYLCIR